MLYVRRGFGDEKSQLNELNCRLNQYLFRVRQLEEENQVLVEEIHRLRLERGAEWAQGYHTEVSKLRMKVEELTVQTSEAEIQKENLWLELQNLQELWEQVRAMRLKIDQQLTLYKQDLEQAKSSQVALEELYFRLQQEREMLLGSQQEELLALRDQALQIPLQITMQAVAHPRLSLTDVQSFSLELSESWKDAFLIYQKKIEELEDSLRLSEEDRHGAEETVRIQRLQVEELRREYEELLGIQKMLEGELLRMKEKYRLEVEEYQIIIEELESERQTISVTITERLQDYHDLMQVKSGLSLEVAAYRALLEAESKKGTVIWTEQSVRDRPAGYVTSTFDESTRFSHKGGKRIEYPITRSRDEIRRKTQSTNMDRFITRTVPATQIRSQYTNLGNTSTSYVSRVHDNPTQEKSGRWDTSMSSRYGLSHNTKLPQTTYYAAKPTIVTPYSSVQSKVISETTKAEQIKELKPVARPRTQSRESRKVQVNIGTEDNRHELSSQIAFETKVIEERKATSKTVEEEKKVSKTNENYTPKGIIINKDTASVTETVQKETIQEPKAQDLPVKKERKKREQAKKRKEEEVEKVEIGDMNVETGSKAEVHETTQVKKTVVLEEKPQAEQIIFELPIQVETRRNESNSQKSNKENKTARNVSHTYVNEEFAFRRSDDELKTVKNVDSSKTGDAVIFSSEPREEKTMVDDILRHLSHSSVASVETKEQGSGSRTFVLGEKMQGEPVVLEIPIKLEVIKTQLSSKKGNVEQPEQSTFVRNDKERNVNEESTFQRTEEMHETNKDVENKGSSYTEESGRVDISAKNFEQKAMVADILRQLGLSSGLDDTNVTYVKKKEQCNDGSVKTEIFVQSRTEEEIDLFDEPDLTDLWNTTTTQSPQKSGGTGKAEHLDEEHHSKKIKKTILEDVTGAEAEEWIGNIVHTGLKDSPGKSVNVEIVEETFETFGYDKGEFSTPFHVEEAEDSYNVEGSVNIEEHVSLKTDKLHDKIQSSDGPTQVEEVTEGENVDEETSYFVSIPEDNPYIEEEEEDTLKGQIHTEEESHVKYSWQDEFLQGSQGRKALSEFLKNAAATEPNSTSHVTSENSSDRLENEEQKKGSRTETVVIEKKIQVPHEIQSSIMEFLSKDVKDPHEKLKGALECLQGSLPQDLAEELAMLAGEEQTESNSLALDIKKVGQTEESGVVTIVAEINISQTMDIDNLDDLDKIEGFRNQETAIHKTHLKSSEDLTSFQPKESVGSKESVSVTVGTNNEHEFYTTEEISQKGPTTTSVHFSPTRELSLGQLPTNVTSFIKHVELGGHEQILQDDSRLDKASSDELSPTEVNRSEHHIKLGPREMHSRKHIIFEGPISETLKLDIVKNTDDTSDQNISIRHIKISPTEKYPTEQIVFQGPIFKTGVIGANITGDVSVKENFTDGVNQAIQNLSFERIQASDQENSEFSTGVSKTISHFKHNSGETLNKEIILEGSIPRAHDLGRHITLEDDSKPIEYNFSAQKIHVGKQIKYQGFVSEPHKVADTGNLVESKDQSNVNTSIHHIKLSPSREQIVFEGLVSSNLPIRGEDSSLLEDSNRSIRYIQLGSPETYTSEQETFEGPTSESYESSDFFVSSPSGDSSESERSIKHIKLGPTEKSFTFQMDITKIAKNYSGEKSSQESGPVVTSRKFEGLPEFSQSYSELTDDPEVTESGYGEEEIAGVSQLPYNIMPHGQSITDISELDKTVQLQRIVHQSNVVSDDKKVAVVYLDEEEEPDQDYLRRSF
ncbi:synemin [Pseudophryne corroboree]|uniref:synemin n=1 Tax=Pseudophryne corroboree TaxID=495146 RepID=UPI0030812FFB